jgi:hypothetical protein
VFYQGGGRQIRVTAGILVVRKSTDLPRSTEFVVNVLMHPEMMH